MNRRGFLASMLAAGAAPAVVRAASLMPVKTLQSGVLVPRGEIVTVCATAADSVALPASMEGDYQVVLNQAWMLGFSGDPVAARIGEQIRATREEAVLRSLRAAR